MKKFSKLILSVFFIGFILSPIGNVFGIEGISTTEVQAAKKKVTQKSFNKQASTLSKKVKNYKSEIADNLVTLNENRMYNAENFALLFEDETLGMSDDEVLTYYLQLVSKFADREDSLDEIFDQDEIDIISDYMYDIRDVNSKIDKLNQKIADYEKKYNSLVKSKSYEEAIKERNNQIKAYGQLSKIMANGNNLEYDLYYETKDLFADLIPSEDENDDSYYDDEDQYDDGYYNEDDYYDDYYDYN